MSWILSKQFRFEAAHKLPHHDGKCQRLHGHSWKMTVFVCGHTPRTTGPKSGMVLDYDDIKRAVSPIIEERLDHHYLNESTGLENPTCEEVARWAYTVLLPGLPGLFAIEIEETCTSACRYEPEGDGG